MPPTPETEPFPNHLERMEWLNELGNHEGKLILATLFASQPEVPMSSRRMARAISQLQERPPAWPMSDGGLLTYCEGGLTHAGIVRRVSATTYAGRKEVAAPLLAFSGAILGWSLDYPDISTQNIWGLSTTAGTGSLGSPEVRHEIYAHLLHDPPEGKTMAEIFHGFAANYSRTNISHQIERLSHLGVVNLVSKMAHYNPGFTLTGPAEYFDERLDSRSAATPEAEVLYRTLGELARGERTEYTLTDFLNACAQVESAEPFSLAAVRKLFLQGHNQGRVGVRFHDTNDLDYSNVTLRPEYVEPIADIISRIWSSGDPELAPLYAARARRIISSKSAMQQLMAKAKRFSRSRHWIEPSEELTSRLLNIIGELGDVSVTQAMGLVSSGDRAVDREPVSKVLRDLTKAGKLIAVKVQEDPSKSRRVYRYRLAPGSPDQEVQQ